MKASEINANYGYYDPDDDKLNQFKKSDTRKSRLTLRDLNKLKKIRATRRLEMLQRNDMLELIYGEPDGGDDGGMGMGMGL
jgi:hypothetical protein